MADFCVYKEESRDCGLLQKKRATAFQALGRIGALSDPNTIGISVQVKYITIFP